MVNIMSDLWCKYFNKLNKLTNEKIIIAKNISNFVKTINRNNLLDIGCGTGEIVNYLHKYFKNTYAFDLNKGVQKYLKKDIKYYFDSDTLDKLHVNNMRFDLIILSYVFSSDIDYNTNLIYSAYKLLNDGGVICIVNLSEYGSLKWRFKEITGAINYSNFLTITNTDLIISTDLVETKFIIPNNKLILFKKIYGFYPEQIFQDIIISGKQIKINILHEIMFCHKQKRKLKVYLFSGKVCSGKTICAKRFTNYKTGIYFNIDNYLKKLAKKNNLNFTTYLNDLISKDKLAIIKLITNTVNAMLINNNPIILDGVFSLAEIDYFKTHTSAEMVSIYIHTYNKNRLLWSLYRCDQNIIKTRQYIKQSDRDCFNYGGGVYSLKFNYKIDNYFNKKKLFKTIKDIAHEI